MVKYFDENRETMMQWTENELEEINQCPFCETEGGMPLYADVSDLAFGVAGDGWGYKKCLSCQSIYLDPRPTQETIGRAYTSYYTHGRRVTGGVVSSIRNTVWFMLYGIELLPRIAIPRICKRFMAPLKYFIAEPFPLEFVLPLQAKTILDVGCGNGQLLSFLRERGWTTTGIELDPLACVAAQNEGLDVREGDFRILESMHQNFDYIICSHVLEHVGEPRILIKLLFDSLAPGGQLFLATPNANSHVHQIFGKYWRGLEAPRHFEIPSLSALLTILSSVGFEIEKCVSSVGETYAESLRMKRGAKRPNLFDRMHAAVFRWRSGDVKMENYDFIKVIARKSC